MVLPPRFLLLSTTCTDNATEKTKAAGLNCTMVKTPFRFDSSSKCVHVTQDGTVATYCTGEAYSALLGSDTGILFGDPNLVITGSHVRSAIFALEKPATDIFFNDEKDDVQKEAASRSWKL